jgi:DNA-binding transcriptional regulator YdaS (Cro superfamily)
MQVRDLIQAAIDKAGSQAKLGKAIGKSQNAVHQALKRGKVTAEMAVSIERATEGEVRKEQLRPDLFAQEPVA